MNFETKIAVRSREVSDYGGVRKDQRGSTVLCYDMFRNAGREGPRYSMTGITKCPHV